MKDNLFLEVENKQKEVLDREEKLGAKSPLEMIGGMEQGPGINDHRILGASGNLDDPSFKD